MASNRGGKSCLSSQYINEVTQTRNFLPKLIGLRNIWTIQPLRIVDARPPQQYAAGHIPGAVNLPGTNGIPRTADGEMASAQEFSAVAGNLGIGNGGTIIVYDIPNQHMGLVAWAFLYYGHQDVRLLDGGFEKWSREGRPVSMQEVSYPMNTFNGQPVETIYCSFSHAKASHGRPETVFWDTRSLAEFTAPAKDTGSLLQGLGISRARPISTGLNLSTRRQRPSKPQPSCVRCWNRKASHQIGK
ncbi:MAG TPA: rhodanese-like domain-containing protein [Candidatus Binatia bacterium]|jgi:3-mercaptopyruvate sulfurtransferase SseA